MGRFLMVCQRKIILKREVCMRLKDLLHMINAYEKENLRTELKQIDKFLTEDHSFRHKEMAALLTSFANREGGVLIIGVKDDGSFEGSGLFDALAQSNKSGFDKFKEHIENLCKDIISPRLFVEIQYFSVEENDVCAIIVPRRKTIPHAVVAKHEGSAIRAREYYIRSNHGISLVSDRQLEWLFLNRSQTLTKHDYEIAVTVNRTLDDIPVQIAPYAINIQPEYTTRLKAYLELIDQTHKKSMIDSPETFKVLLGELLMYVILQSQHQHFEKDKALPLPIDNMQSSIVLDDSVKKIIRKKRNLWSVPYGTAMKWSSNGDWTRLKFGNRFMIGSLIITPIYHKPGLNRNNPLIVSEDVVTFGYTITLQTVLKFPEYEEEGYQFAHYFGEALSEHIQSNWDINTHYQQIPHSLLVYEINQKLDELLGKK